ncbi:MAG: response regulator [Cellulosilyticum sp.]|nr:response regulator [Cellulosilyticum sp.]
MNIIAVDDETLALNSLIRVLKQVFVDMDIKGFQKSCEALQLIDALSQKGEKLDYAFLDVEMRGISGIELAKRIKEICPETRILFVSAYDHYACEAFQIHAKGYILKPATKELIEESLE